MFRMVFGEILEMKDPIFNYNLLLTGLLLERHTGKLLICILDDTKYV